MVETSLHSVNGNKAGEHVGIQKHSYWERQTGANPPAEEDILQTGRIKKELAEIMGTDTWLILCWQCPEMTINEYTREFKARS